MKIGYPCINRTIGCSSGRTFRLGSYSPDLLREKVTTNLQCLKKILVYNAEKNLLFFRIGSQLIPFASHEVCDVDWAREFQKELSGIGDVIKKQELRISMHPDQFTLINSRDEDIFTRSAGELRYHTQILDGMGLDATAKIQIHVGGVYGDKEQSIARFIRRYQSLSPAVRRRLVIENDDKSYTLSDCMIIHRAVKIPVLLDVLHHTANPGPLSLSESLRCAVSTWSNDDGIPMIDYSSQRVDSPRGMHAESIDLSDFRSFISSSRPHDFDIMLEIKDKEQSALRARKVLERDARFMQISRGGSSG